MKFTCILERRKKYSALGERTYGALLFKRICKIGTVHKGTSHCQPRTNSKVERLNGILKDMISKLLLSKPMKVWDLYLDQVLCACRIWIHSTTKTSPFSLLYGRQPHLLGDPNNTLPIDVGNLSKSL